MKKNKHHTLTPLQTYDLWELPSAEEVEKTNEGNTIPSNESNKNLPPEKEKEHGTKKD